MPTQGGKGRGRKGAGVAAHCWVHCCGALACAGRLGQARSYVCMCVCGGKEWGAKSWRVCGRHGAQAGQGKCRIKKRVRGVRVHEGQGRGCGGGTERRHGPTLHGVACGGRKP